MSNVSFRIDFRQFDRVFPKYLELSSHTPSEVVNKKAFFVARRAVRETPATTKDAITSSLGKIIRTKKTVVAHMVKAQATYAHLANSKKGEAPLAALIINHRLHGKGEPGLQGTAMTAAIISLISARSRSRSFLKSGWLPAIRTLAPLVTDRKGEPPLSYKGAKQYGTEKGRAVPARPGWTARAIIENAASGDHETHEALVRYGGPALQRAFDFEAASMTAEVARRQYLKARALGIRVTATGL